MLTHLPPGLAGFLNAVYWNAEECETEWQEFCDTWDSIKGWHDFHGSYSVNDKEQGELENFQTLWDEVRVLVENPPNFAELARPVYETIQLMNQVNENRRFPHYSPIPAFNEILLAGAAFCMDRGSEESVRARLALLSECNDNLRGLFYEQKAKLPEEIQEALQQGFDLITQGIELIHHNLPNKEPVTEGLACLKEGGSLVEFLIDWDRKETERLRGLYTRFNIPVIGADLEISLESMKLVERRKWRRGAKVTEEEHFPKLDEFWALIKPHLILPHEEGPELLDEVEQSMLALKEAVAALKEKEYEDEELWDALTDAVEWTSESFTALEAHSLKADVFGVGPERDIFEAIKGILSGTVPDAALVDLLKDSPLSEGDQNVFQQYINEGSYELLIEAAWTLYDVVMERAEALEDDQPWTCGFCSHVNEADQVSCRECQVIRAQKPD